MHKPYTLEMVPVGSRRSARTTFRKFHRRGHLMVPSWPVALSGIYITSLMAVGRHWSVRSIEATSLHVGLEAHVLLLPLVGHVSVCVCHVPCVLRANRLTCISAASHISHPGHADHLCMHKSHTLLMVHLGLPVAREDHFEKLRRSGHPTVPSW